ncbi:MAG: tRNA (guanosine(46)-N7)-methyltransferase TrmB [Bacteroidales bacterium]|jgi:tRNA (guanine-N7-)-methyltransferase|nr:tRNA (guanosine(46)-N7)-methyltransferase TrmB [Bacteroidales bacterium]MCI1784679.1 tRNA (guanosine(46)-N7)-methyltransferase TrmB [Bacteroidales bacterium]
MGHGKLKKFEENKTFSCLLQPESVEVLAGTSGFGLTDHPIKGHWNDVMFKKPAPIVLELGCGRGEYTIDLAHRNPEFNYIGVDIKGARLWRGAKDATEESMGNVAFLRTRIEFAEAFFAPGEISEIWLTFSDPQIKSENNRLTSPLFLERYGRFLKPGGIIHLKTDSIFLHEYTKAVCKENGLSVIACTEDLYGSDRSSLYDSALASVCGIKAVDSLFEVRTYYERMFLEQGLKITYMAFVPGHGPYSYPEWDPDYWKKIEGNRRTFGHGSVQ